MQKEYISKNEQDTINFATRLAANLKIGDIIVLSGDLGAVKTKFTQGILIAPYLYIILTSID